MLVKYSFRRKILLQYLPMMVQYIQTEGKSCYNVYQCWFNTFKQKEHPATIFTNVGPIHSNRRKILLQCLPVLVQYIQTEGKFCYNVYQCWFNTFKQKENPATTFTNVEQKENPATMFTNLGPNKKIFCAVTVTAQRIFFTQCTQSLHREFSSLSAHSHCTENFLHSVHTVTAQRIFFTQCTQSLNREFSSLSAHSHCTENFLLIYQL